MKLSLFTLLCCITYVAAHGYVQKIAIDGKNYEGDNVNNPSNKPSAIRVTSSVGGVNSVSSPDIACGVNSKPGQLVADAMPGSTVQFSWVTGQGQPGWIHKLGPIIAYLARCENGCSTFDATQGDWFKVFQSGYNNGAWGVAAMNQGQPVSIPLPSTLPPGEYLLRFEFIALHLAMNPGGAEFFVSCAQLKVGGSQSGVIDSSEKVKFPGAYHTNDPGILLDIYTGFSPANYVFPGPSLAKIAGGGGPNGSNGAPTVAPPTGSPVSSPQPST
ncbi:lytic polysaccharide monooxygenase, partial [Amanita thiersii Skay4041]